MFLSLDLSKVIYHIKPIKYKGFEVELREMIKETASTTRQAKEERTNSQREFLSSTSKLRYNRESKVYATEPYSAIIWYYGEIERTIRELLAKEGLIEEGGSISFYRLVTIARENQLMPLKLISAVPKFGGISNKMAQGNLEVVDESTLSKAASIGNEILGMVLAVAETTGHKKENHE